MRLPLGMLKRKDRTFLGMGIASFIMLVVYFVRMILLHSVMM